MASIDAYPITSVAGIGSIELVTFDDGTANITPGSTYYKHNFGFRNSVYRKVLRAPTILDVKRNIARHYTLHPDLPNIVSGDKVRCPTSIHPWTPREINKSVKTYFVGSTWGDREQSREVLSRIAVYLNTRDIDFYVRHPQERKAFAVDAEDLEKHGMIAEDAILRNAADHEIHLIGLYSSVLFNLGKSVQRRTMLIPATEPNALAMSALGRRSGCEIVMI